MPCYDPRPSETDGHYAIEEARRLRRENAVLEAILCGALRLHGPQLTFDLMDWKAVGVTRRVAEEWWENHKRQDAQRVKKGYK